MTVAAAVGVLSQRGASAAAHLAARCIEPRVFERTQESKAAAAVTSKKQSRHGNVRPPRHTLNFINATPADANTPELIGIHHPAGRS